MSQPSLPEPAPPPPAGLVATFRRLGPAGFMAIGAAALPPIGMLVLFANLNPLGEWLASHGNQGVALYIAGFMVFAGLALLPTYASAILGGWAFGFGIGFPAALAGFMGGAMIAYCIARLASGDRVVAVIDERPKWKAVRQALVGSGFWRTLGIVILLRVPFNSPFAMCNLVLASLKVPPVIYFFGTLIGMAPRTGVVLYLAVLFRDRFARLTDAVEATPLWFIIVGVASAVVILLIITLIARRAIERVVASGAASVNPPAAGAPE